MKILPKVKPLAKKLLLAVLITIVVISAIFGILIVVPLSSSAEPKNVQSVNSRFGLMFPAESTVIDNEWFHPMGELGYYAIVRIRSQEVDPFLAVSQAVIHSPSQGTHARKSILQDWQNTGEFWSSWTIGHAGHYQVISDETTQIFVDLDDPKFATVYVMEHEYGT